MTQEPMTKQEALDFFSEIYGGSHHLPSKIKEFGYGWSINNYGDLSTYDFNKLTRLVFLAHDKCYRLEIRQGAPGAVKICIWKRYKREGRADEMHPTIEVALAKWRGNYA